MIYFDGERHAILYQNGCLMHHKIYLAGPMTGLPDYNYPAFHAAASKLRALGYCVENPAEHDIPHGNEWHVYLRDAITRMLTCTSVATLPGWNQSKGARLEIYIASMLQMPIHDARDLIIRSTE